jgi:hypothetical protein
VVTLESMTSRSGSWPVTVFELYRV